MAKATAATTAAKSLQLCPTFHDPMDCSLTGSFIHGIFQARVLEWVVIAFSKATADFHKSLTAEYVSLALDIVGNTLEGIME